MLTDLSPHAYCATTDEGFGLLLDVDGPISSPVTRSISQPGLVESLVTLANSGVPIAFNTGRGDDFLNREVTGPLYAAGLNPDALVWGIGEKGATWFRLGVDTPIAMDGSLVIDLAIRNQIRELVERDFADLVFFDESKRTMVSVEQRVEIESADFLARRPRLDRALAQIVLDAGYDISWHGNVGPELLALATDPAAHPERTNIRLDSSIIATDIEHSATGKDLGAKRFMDLLIADGVTPPHRWFTMGDSQGDYAMTQWLHDNGFSASHVDVRPAEQLRSTEFPVLMHPTLINDEAGEFFLTAWARKVA